MHSRFPFGVILLGIVCPGLPLAAQDPGVTAKDPAKEVEELTAEKQRLQREIEFVKRRVADSRGGLMKNYGAQGTHTWKTIDAGRTVVSQPVAPPVAARHARLMLDDERANNSGDTMLLVNGNPIRQASFDELSTYQNQLQSDAPPQMRAQAVLGELIRIEAISTAFAESEAEVKLAEALAAMEGGKPISEMIQTHGTLRNAPPDGRIELTRQSPYGLKLEQVAFATPPNQRSRPFRHHSGFAVVFVEKLEKGASPELDKATVLVLNVPYGEQEVLQKQEALLATGQVEIIARDKQVLEMVPTNYRDPDEVRAAQGSPLESMAKALEQIDAQIEKLSASGSQADKDQAEDLKRRRDHMKSRIEKIKAHQPGDTTPPPK